MPATGLVEQPPEDDVGGAGRQVASSHTALEAHSSPVTHAPKHLPVTPSHRYGAHVVAPLPSFDTDCEPSSLHVAAIGTQPPSTHVKSSAQSDLVAHDDPQRVASAQAYGAHGCVTGGLHTPLPSHVDGCARTPALQVCGEHVVLALAKPAQVVASLPSQLRAAHTWPPPASHAVRAPCGCPPTTVEHVPIAPARSQAAHCSVHARSQHTPSTQKPLAHSVAEPHEVPFVFAQVPALPAALQAAPLPQLASAQQTPSVQKAPAGHREASLQASPSFESATHAPETQVFPAAQSAGEAQLVWHLDAVASQAKGAHARGTSLQRPAPSQKLAWVSVAPAHASALQAVAVDGKPHWLVRLPSHWAPQVPPLGAMQGPRPPTGAPTVLEQTPAGASQRAHTSLHAVLQQTPSATKPLAQVEATVAG